MVTQGGCLPGDSCCNATTILEQRWQRMAHTRPHLQQTGPTSVPGPIQLQAEGEMPFVCRAELQAADRQASEGAAHSPPSPPSSPRVRKAPVWTSSAGGTPGVSMEEKTSECRPGDLPGREGLSTAPASLLHAWEWSLMLDPSEAAAQSGQSQGTITQS